MRVCRCTIARVPLGTILASKFPRCGSSVKEEDAEGDLIVRGLNLPADTTSEGNGRLSSDSNGSVRAGSYALTLIQKSALMWVGGRRANLARSPLAMGRSA